jgi:hypothetical protein
MVLDTADYNQKITAILEDQAEEGTHRVHGMQDHSFPEEVSQQLWLQVPGPTTVWAAKHPQAKGSLKAYCEHHWGHHLSLGQTPGKLTGLSYWQLSTPCKELNRR